MVSYQYQPRSPNKKPGAGGGQRGAGSLAHYQIVWLATCLLEGAIIGGGGGRWEGQQLRQALELQKRDTHLSQGLPAGIRQVYLQTQIHLVPL